MKFNWPELKTIKANEVANDLKLLCRFLDSNTPLSTEEKIEIDSTKFLKTQTTESFTMES